LIFSNTLLEHYLNSVHFGRNTQGILAASREYFGEDPSNLTVSKGALLAGLIDSPPDADPMDNGSEARARWNHTLDRMVDAEFITPIERAQQVFPEVMPY
jgi:peptidoglycan glycosyltransferase